MSTQALPDDLDAAGADEFDFTLDAPAQEEDIDVAVSDPEYSRPDDAGKPVATADSPVDEITDEDLENYRDEKVRKRIQRLTAQAHEQRRRAEEEAARNAELTRLLKDAATGRAVLLQTTAKLSRSALEAQLAQAAEGLKQARESGDIDKEIAQQTALTRITQQLASIPPDDAVTRDVEAERARMDAMLNRPAAPETTLSQQTADWISRNQWFNTDPAMRNAAIGAHSLVVQAGVAPDTPEYFARIEGAVSAMFPGKVSMASSPPAPKALPKASSAAPVVRTAPNGKQRVTLTPAQRDLAIEILGPAFDNDPQKAMMAYARELAKGAVS